MRRPRFLIVAGRTGSLREEAAYQIKQLLPRHGQFSLVWSSRRVIMFAEEPWLPLDHGAIVGSVFRSGMTVPIDALSSSDISAVERGQGQYLIDAHWGGYVALIDTDGLLSVLRAPLGDLPCLKVEGPDRLIFASDPEMLAIAGCRLTVHYPGLARHLGAADLHRSETCLADVEELQGGTRFDLVEGAHRVTERWSPWRFAARERQIDDPTDARHRLEGAILHAVAGSCWPHGSVVLRLSGGLDSSIVAAGLADAGIETTALNLTGGDAAGDERRYARAVAAALGITIVERERRLDAVDLYRSAAAGAPRPVARAFVQSSLDHALSIAADCGAGAIVDGGGGDNVFCSLQSVRPVIDAMLTCGDRRLVRTTARAIAALADVSEWTVLRRAWLARLRGRRGYSFATDRRFLSADARAVVSDTADHAWLHAQRDALPGKAAHIGLIAIAQSVAEGLDPRDPVPLLSPLISQPVVEACLRIPTWQWYDRGLNRAVARRAFADRLPTSIIERRSKGGPDAFIADLYHLHRIAIREILLDGLLAGHGLLDRVALCAVLDERGPVRGHDYIRVMQLVDAETWARSI